MLSNFWEKQRPRLGHEAVKTTRLQKQCHTDSNVLTSGRCSMRGLEDEAEDNQEVNVTMARGR